VKSGIFSLFLCIDVKWDPTNSFYMKKVWLFSWVTSYSRWISWETTQYPVISMNSLQLFQVYAGCNGASCVCTQNVVVQKAYVHGK
jgi:hypothetical protein